MDAVGGRKFLMAIVLIIAGVIIELYSKNGLSTNMAGMLAAIYATFSASNAIITNRQLAASQQQPAEEEASPTPAPQPNGLTMEAVQPAFQAIDQAYVKMQETQSSQAQQLNTLQKAVTQLLQGRNG